MLVQYSRHSSQSKPHSSAQPLSVYPRSSPRNHPGVLAGSGRISDRRRLNEAAGSPRRSPCGDSILRGRFARHPAGLHRSPESRCVAFRGPSSEGFCRMPRLLNRGTIARDWLSVTEHRLPCHPQKSPSCLCRRTPSSLRGRSACLVRPEWLQLQRVFAQA